MINKFLLKEFGLKIRDLRNQEKLSQEQLSFKTGFHRTYIGMVERGERNISLTNIAVFAKAFQMNISELLSFDNSKYTYLNYEFKNNK